MIRTLRLNKKRFLLEIFIVSLIFGFLFFYTNIVLAQESDLITDCEDNGGYWNPGSGKCDVGTGGAQGDVAEGLKSAVQNCTGASGVVSNALGSLGRILGNQVGGPAGSIINSAVGKVTSGATGAITGAVNTATKEAAGAVSGAADAIISGAGSAVGSVFQDLGVSLGSQGVADIGNYLNSWTSGGLSGLSSVFGGGLGSLGGGLGSAFSAITGGGGPIPTADDAVRKSTASSESIMRCQNGLAYQASRINLAEIISRTANYINTGNKGNPFYPTNLGDYYAQVSQEEANKLIREIQGSDSPFKNQVVPSIIKASQNNSLKQSGYTLDQVAGGSAQAERFASGDPNACSGYLRCLSYQADPSNNPIGFYNLSMQKLGEEQSKAALQARDEYLAGQGFVPDKECVEYATDYEDSGDVTECIRWEVKNPAANIRASSEELAVNAIKETRSADSVGEQLSPFFSRFANQILAGGLSLLSNALKGGSAASISAYRLNNKNQVNAAISIATGNTATYRSLVQNESIPIVSSVIDNLNSLNDCYVALDTVNSGDNQIDKPAAGEIALISNYQTILTSYQNQLASINQNPSQITGDSALSELVTQTDILKGKQAAISGYLASCRAQAEALGAINQTNSNKNNDSD